MRKLKVYLDTSVINFLYAEDAADYMKVTKEFFDSYLDSYEVYISEIVLLEIERTTDTVRKKLLHSVIAQYGIEIYGEVNEEIQSLAEKYIKQGLVPQKKFDDAVHVAFATYYEFDVLLSWNFKHMANIMKQTRINAFNESEGYSKRLNLLSPMEVIYEK